VGENPTDDTVHDPAAPGVGGPRSPRPETGRRRWSRRGERRAACPTTGWRRTQARRWPGARGSGPPRSARPPRPGAHRRTARRTARGRRPERRSGRGAAARTGGGGCRGTPTESGSRCRTRRAPASPGGARPPRSSSRRDGSRRTGPIAARSRTASTRLTSTRAASSLPLTAR
jgi:hypothetical protein